MTREILIELYNQYHNGFGGTPEYEKAEVVFNTDTEEKAAETLRDAVYAETELAFKSGFYAAVALLIGGAK